MMRNTHFSVRTLATALLHWLPVFTIGLLVFPLANLLGILRVYRGADWHPLRTIIGLDHADLVVLVALALAIVVPSVLVRRRVWRQARQEELQALAAATIRSENEAVVRVCQAVAREFVQPLTGALVYSELLLQDSQSPSESQRRALEGLREGVTRLEHLLYSVRDAAQHVPAAAHGEHVADLVVRAVGHPVPRWHALAQDREKQLA